MLLGTNIGVLVIPGLHYLFAKLAGDGKLLPDETAAPLSETDRIHVEHHTQGAVIATAEIAWISARLQSGCAVNSCLPPRGGNPRLSYGLNHATIEIVSYLAENG